jgi:hypothetical protein
MKGDIKERRDSHLAKLSVLSSITHTTTQVSSWGWPLGRPPTQEKQMKEVITSKPTSKVPNTTVMAQENKYNKLWETYVLCAY